MTTAMGITKAIRLQATFARTITGPLTEIAMAVKTAMVTVQATHQM